MLKNTTLILVGFLIFLLITTTILALGPRPVSGAKDCGRHEYYVSCGSQCLPSCLNTISNVNHCHVKRCFPGCVCNTGYIRLGPSAKCVRHCPKKTKAKGKTVVKNQQLAPRHRYRYPKRRMYLKL